MSRLSVIRGKLRPPPRPEVFVPRGRISAIFKDLLESYRLITVVAAAGSGKTTAVAQAVAELDMPVAWLTLDDTDSASGRLVTYLEAAIASRSETVADVASAAMATGIPHPEAAGLLAEATSDHRFVMVIDEVDRLHDDVEALAVIEGFIRHLPRQSRVILVSRWEIKLNTQLGVAVSIGDRELAFSLDEAASLIEGYGSQDISPEQVIEESDGWVTGAVYRVQGGAAYRLQDYGESDPLNGYLASQLLEKLPPELQDFLIVTSPLERVTARRAEAMGITEPGEKLTELRRRHVLASWSLEDGIEMRCHPRFREYLMERLSRRGEEAERAVRARFAALLADEGYYEEATDQYLLAGHPDRAREAARQVLPGIVKRQDLALADRWLETFPATVDGIGDEITEAALLLAVARENFAAGVEIGADLSAETLPDFVRRSPISGTMLVWCLFHTDRLEEAREVVEWIPAGIEEQAALYLLSLASPNPLPGDPPRLTGGEFDALIVRVHSIRGQIAELESRFSRDWEQAVVAAWGASAARATGRAQRALDMYRAAVDQGTDTFGSFHTLVAVDILLELKQYGEAEKAIQRGRELLARTGSSVFEMQRQIGEAKVLLVVHEDVESALAKLEAIEQTMPVSRYRYVQEFLDTWYGRLLLHLGRDEEAHERLAGAVASMRLTDRILELPSAAVYLAEAEWRLGNEDAADQMADLALETARRQGSSHVLLQALRAFPAVVSRRLDAELGAGSAWFDLGQALSLGIDLRSQPGNLPGLVREFGEPGLTYDGVDVDIKLRKSLELLVLLTLADGRESRDKLLDSLFEGRDDDSTRAYLRQAARQLRAALPAGVTVESDGSELTLVGANLIRSESRRFEELIDTARGQGAADRIRTLGEALVTYGQGEYLSGIDTDWVESRRTELDRLAVDAWLDSAAAALELDRYAEARALASEALARDPLRETGWRLLMKVADRLGDVDTVLAEYRRCEEVLDEVGMKPSRATRELLTTLRG